MKQIEIWWNKRTDAQRKFIVGVVLMLAFAALLGILAWG